VHNMGKNWDHFKTMQALDAYADFLTLKVLEKDYDATLLLPTDIIDEVSAWANRPYQLPLSGSARAVWGAGVAHARRLQRQALQGLHGPHPWPQVHPLPA
jgi:hypothetical protein